MKNLTYFIITFIFTAVFVTGLFLIPQGTVATEPERECISWETVRTPHHRMCLHGNTHPFCQSAGEWKTYQVCNLWNKANGKN